MLPSRIISRCLGKAFSFLHAATLPVVLKALDALGDGGLLTLTGIARSWPGARDCSAPLKTVDRLLRSKPLERQRLALYAAAVRWLVRSSRPIVVVDWSDLKADRSLKLLRAGLAVRGRTLTLWEEVHPRKTAGQRTEKSFLRKLAKFLPDGCCPIVVSDAGFRRPWFQAVLSLGWDYVGRLRGQINVHSLESKIGPGIACGQLHAQARQGRSLEFGSWRLGLLKPMTVRLVLHAAHPKKRHAYTVQHCRKRDHDSLTAGRSAREPWVLATSLQAAQFPAARVARVYARRMTVELSFRDLKDSRYGAGLAHSMTRKRSRLAILLLLFFLTQFAAWLVGLCEETHGDGHRLAGKKNPRRRQYSTMRLGMEILRHPAWWPPEGLLKSFLSHTATGDCAALDTLALC